MTIAVSIIEDDDLVRSHLVDLIISSNRCELIGSASNGAGAIELITQDKTDVYLVDLGLPDADGVDLIALIKSSCRTARSMVLSMFGDAKHINRSILAGASGYLLKDGSDAMFIDRIVTLHNGESPISPCLVKIIFQEIWEQNRINHSNDKNFAQFMLAPRELEIMHFLVSGMTILNIGNKLFISPHTVNQHLRSIYRKLDVHSRAMAVSTAIQHGYLNI